ncbi:MAG TPA: 2-oxoacid:acceptor oxidoreductase subunit alpha [Fibrobacteria bacterium]|nr:2-oxoacid:acceptor oxidoreductase subunit alpha [Fibrobacteria bacterium]
MSDPNSQTILGPDGRKDAIELHSVTIRFAGDSGDGMQLTGTQFTDEAAFVGNDLATLPDYPSEIRAPAGTVAGVSAFQLHFSSQDIKTPGDDVDVLVAMNAAALKVNLRDLHDGGIVLVDNDGFGEKDLEKAGYAANPLEDGSLKKYRLIRADITELTVRAVEPAGVTAKNAGRCKNFFTLGMMYWLYGRSPDNTVEWIRKKFGKKPDIAQANEAAVIAGYNYAETAELFETTYVVPKAPLTKGTYKRISGNEATALGFVAASVRAKKPLFQGSYPITPATDILNELAALKHFGVRTFQAEDEIAGACSAIGAAFAGNLAITTTSGPGLCLKSEAMNLAVMAELPLVVVNVQRGGPSTGMPTKTEQSDLLQALFGRNGDSPMPVIAAKTPSDCFWAAMEACKVAVEYMTPVVLLTDGYIANGAEPFRIPEIEDLPTIEVVHADDPSTFKPYLRNAKGARPWAVPGTPGLEHRIGGLEKSSPSGAVSHDPENHQKMTLERQEKVASIQTHVGPTRIDGCHEGDLLVISWGGTYGAVSTAVDRLLAEGKKVGHVHLRWINPLPNDLEQVMDRFKQVLVPELNVGQLKLYLTGKFGRKMHGLGKVMGKPFKINELVKHMNVLLETKA